MVNLKRFRHAAKYKSLRPRHFPALLVSAILTFAAAPAFYVPLAFAKQLEPAQTRTKTTQDSAPASRYEARPTRIREARPHPEPLAAKPQAPAQPDWPINQRPNPAKITWNARGLEIVASNSSLDQILHEVGTNIGATVTGLSTDERIFGTYGPGPAHDVLSRLLNGSGYNVIMIGDRGNGAPRQIELSTSTPGGNPPQASPRNAESAAEGPDQSEDGDQQEQGPPQFHPPIPGQPSQPLPLRSPFGNGEPPRSPQQIMQEMQQREMQKQYNQQP